MITLIKIKASHKIKSPFLISVLSVDQW